MRGRTALLGLILAGGLCAGCADNTPPIERASTAPFPQAVPSADEAPVTGEKCPSDATDPAIKQLAADSSDSASQSPLSTSFVAVAAVRCLDEVETVAGDGTWNIAVEQRATSDLSALITALRTPSSNAPAGSNIACADPGVLIPLFALVDAQGRITRPALPHDECQMPLPQALAAISALPWKTEAEQRLSQVQTQSEVDTGCPSTYKDTFDFDIPNAKPWTAPLDPTTACEYTATTPTSADPGIAIGDFSHGVKLSSAQQHAIASALKNLGPATTCTTQASKFLLLTAPTQQNLVVELDGCRRVSYPDYYVMQAPASLLAALSTAGF